MVINSIDEMTMTMSMTDYHSFTITHLKIQFDYNQLTMMSFSLLCVLYPTPISPGGPRSACTISAPPRTATAIDIHNVISIHHVHDVISIHPVLIVGRQNNRPRNLPPLGSRRKMRPCQGFNKSLAFYHASQTDEGMGHAGIGTIGRTCC